MTVRREARIRPPLVLALVSVVVLLLWVSGAAALCPRIKYVSVCDEWVEIGWTLGVDEAGIDDFGGYRVWMRDVNDDLEFELARQYTWGQNDPDSLDYWGFDPFDEDSIRVYVDSMSVVNGRPYRFSVTAFVAGADTVATACLAKNATDNVFTGPQIEFIEITDKGVDIGWNMAVNEDAQAVENFGGYRVWIRDVWAEEEFHLAREYVRAVNADAGYDSTAAGFWDFDPYYIDPVRLYRNRSLQNGFPYMFSVTAFDDTLGAVNTRCRRRNSRVFADGPGDPGYYYPREGTKASADEIQVIPNPYRAGADWELGGERRVMFIGLPYPATIRIYTVSGSLVRTLTEDDGRDPDSDQQPWNLKNADGEEIAPGVYIWNVESSAGEATGKMMIIK